VNMNKFLNPLNNMKAGRAKARAYADGGEVNMYGVTPEETFVGKLMAQRGKPLEEQLARPTTMDDPAMGFAGTTVGKVFAPVKVGIQSPELIQATKDVAAGAAGAREARDALVSKIYTPNPITEIYDLTPEPQLASKIKDKLFKNREVPAGTVVDVRPDINSAKGAGNTTRAVTFHTPAGGEKPGKAIGYDSHALLDNFRVIDAPNTSLKIATGQSKEPSTRLSGRYTPTTQAEAKELAESFLKDPTVTQATFNPHIHGYAFELGSGKPITGGGQVLMYGHKMFVKDPIYGDPKKYKYADGGAVHQRALGAKLFGR
jgi:hypothetical protein